MVDYTRGTGNSGTLIIRDNGSTVEFWISCSDPATFVGQLRWSGVVNGVAVSGTSSWSSGGGTRRIAGPWTVSQTTTVTFGIQATGTGGLGGPTSFSATISRPAPNAPSSLSVTRVSDSQQTLNWTRNSTYTSVVVQRRQLLPTLTSWQQVGVASGNAATFTDKSTVANRQYQYRVAGRGASGQSDWSNLAVINTTPIAPIGVTAKRSGSTIVVSAATVSSIAAEHDVRDGETIVSTGVSLPWTHVDPNPAVPHTYTVRSRTTGTLTSDWSSPSNTVQLVAAPNAPTGLAPNGVVWASDEDVLFRWKHNPVDSSDQSEFELNYRLDGGAWTTVPGATAEQLSVPLGVAAVDWQVRTKGAHPDWSPWSSVAAFTVIDRPGVAIVQPEGEWDASILSTEWTWFQGQDRPQSSWQVELLDAANQVVEARSGAGPTTALTFNARLSEGAWTVRVRAATGDVWSVWATVTFPVVFTPPGEPYLVGEWDETQGGVQLSVSGEEYGAGAVLVGGVWYARFGD